MGAIEIEGQTLQALLDELRETHGVVGATLGVLKDGEIEVAASGLLNKATGVEATPDSVFQIGSITKLFTATLMMQLVDEGRVQLDDPVVKHLPDFTIADRDAAKAITIRHLLTHTSGMDGDFFPDDDPEGPSVAGYVRKMCLLPSLYPPGQGPTSYCNAGYVVAGRAIEVLTGRTWENAVMERICKPLGMPAAFAHPHEALRFRCAMGHVADPEDPTKIDLATTTFTELSAAPAGTTLTMSAESLLLFAKTHMADGAYGDDKQLLSSASARAMLEQRVEDSSYLQGRPYVGLGWGIFEGPGYTQVGHNGGTIGQLAYLRTYPDSGVAFTLLTNSPSAKLYEEIRRTLMLALVGAQPPAPLPRVAFALDVERYVGRYSNLNAEWIVAADGDGLSLRVIDRSSPQPEFLGTLEPHRRDIFLVRSEDPRLPDGAEMRILFQGEDEEARSRFLAFSGRLYPRRPG